MGKREEKAMNTKNKIIEAARTLIKENGIENISVDDITKEDDNQCKYFLILILKII